MYTYSYMRIITNEKQVINSKKKQGGEYRKVRKKENCWAKIIIGPVP